MKTSAPALPHTHTRTDNTHTHTHTHTHNYTLSISFSHTQEHENTYSFSLSHTRTWTHTQILFFSLSLSHAHTHTPTHTHTLKDIYAATARAMVICAQGVSGVAGILEGGGGKVCVGWIVIFKDINITHSDYYYSQCPDRFVLLKIDPDEDLKTVCWK